MQMSIVAAVGRLLIAVIFLVSCIVKVTAPTATQSYIASAGLPVPLVAYAVAVGVEAGGGLLLVIGYQTRIIAVVLAAYTFVVALAFHRNFGDQSQLFHFLKNIAMIGGLLQVAAFGAGALSLDARRLKASSLNPATDHG